MSKLPLTAIDPEDVRTVSLTESHHGDRPLDTDQLSRVTRKGDLLILEVGGSSTLATPLTHLELEPVLEVQVVDADRDRITEPQYLLGVGPVEDDDLHIFTDAEV